MPGTEYEFIEELIEATRTRQKDLITQIIEATKQRDLLDDIIDETERRIRETEELRSTPARRRLLRRLRAELLVARGRFNDWVRKISDLTRNVHDLRSGLRNSLRNSFRGLGGLAIGGTLLDILINATAELIRQEIEERYNEDQENRLIDCATRHVRECVGQGVRDWDPEKTADQVNGDGVTPSVVLALAWFPLRDYIHEYDIERWIKNGAHREFPKAWIRLMRACVNDVEDVLKKATIERKKDAYRRPCRERVWATVDQCSRKRPGEKFD